MDGVIATVGFCPFGHLRQTALVGIYQDHFDTRSHTIY